MHIVQFDRGEDSPYVLWLRERDITPTGMPTLALIRRIAERVGRGGDLARPGFVFLANPREVLHSLDDISYFQEGIMKRLHALWKREAPQLLARSDFLNDDVVDTATEYQKWHQRVGIIRRINGVRSFKWFHTDTPAMLYLSFCYYSQAGVSGGSPQVLDLLKMAEHLGEDSTLDMLRFMTVGDEEYYRALLLHQDFMPYRDQFTHRLPSTVAAEYRPMLILSNRTEDGILHGPTRARRKRPNGHRLVLHNCITHWRKG